MSKNTDNYNQNIIEEIILEMCLVHDYVFYSPERVLRFVIYIS